ncbi:MAG: PcfJ domain-containing protein [Acidimicrobiia bacterium]
MPARVLTTVLDRHDSASGDWIVVRADPGRLVVEAGGTGNRLDPARRVRRTAWEVRRIAGDLELVATWPVPEVVTHRIGEHVEQLRDDVVRTGGNADADLAVVVGALPPALVAGPGDRRALDAVLWEAAYPLLRSPIEQGARPDHVPVALDRLLRAPDARSAAQRAFGRVTRPLVRALAASLLPGTDGRVPFEPAVLALMASPWCGPERLVEVLGTPPHRPGSVAFDVGDVDRARSMFHGQPSRRVAARLVSALAEPDGLAGLARELAAWAPEPSPTVERPTTRPQQPPGSTSPTTRTVLPPTGAALDHPAGLRAVDGREVAGHRIVLPRTADELIEWGMVLDNCLGGFRHAVAGRRTHVLGLTRGDALRYAVEVTPSGVVRQFEGPGNRQAPASVTIPVLAVLRDSGVVAADGRRGRSLVAPR